MAQTRDRTQTLAQKSRSEARRENREPFDLLFELDRCELHLLRLPNLSDLSNLLAEKLSPCVQAHRGALAARCRAPVKQYEKLQFPNDSKRSLAIDRTSKTWTLSDDMLIHVATFVWCLTDLDESS